MARAEADAPHAVAAVRRALKDVALALPHLTGLAHAVRVVEDPRVETLGVFRSGRLLVNPARPHRVEPREVKRRPRGYKLMNQPRDTLRELLKKQVRDV